jgi:hypothetical protein
MIAVDNSIYQIGYLPRLIPFKVRAWRWRRWPRWNDSHRQREFERHQSWQLADL